MRKHIFNAGPCKLPDSTLENVSKAVIEFGNTGQSILEVSHRSADFQAVHDEAVALFKEVLNIPEGYGKSMTGGGDRYGTGDRRDPHPDRHMRRRICVLQRTE